ncbi:uncharacterized protein LOC117122676 [Anneissia japonica]|uniref:uncharacterized protein LOC117122676 n=1 Tax=Anneissia japonica TaxID=1529436 RepID=UPI00142595B3|nr:uncharacterized protein LOC117122676 [Anneissia japonica]
MFQTHLIPCTDVVDGKVCKTNTDVLKLADLISTGKDDGDMGPQSHINFHAGSKSNSRASSRKRRWNRLSLNDDVDPAKEHASAIVPDKNDNQTTGNNSIGIEQMYFWARKLAHCNHVNVASMETLRAFLECRVSLLKLKAIRSILKDGDLQDDESLMLIIKDVLQDNLNVLPLILELHFMESKIA